MKKRMLQVAAGFCAAVMVMTGCGAKEAAESVDLREVSLDEIIEKAKEEGLRLKAHVGEWGSANDVIQAINKLHLDEVQHGIAAAHSKEAMDFLKEKKIRLNITPSSNVLLGRVASMKEHPISILFRNGVDVTINSDDVLIFDSDVSQEYLRLYQSGCLSAKELNEIRLIGIQIPNEIS